jgi:hypothetical protein
MNKPNFLVLETMAWCSLHLDAKDPAASLRSEALKPELVILDDRINGHWNYTVPGDPAQYVRNLCVRRGELLRSTDWVDDGRAAMKGRILLFHPHETLCDGAAHTITKGYFDFWNIPPWDTWFGYERSSDGRDVLYSYVPSEFLELAEQGVLANPERCLQWAI